MKAESEEAMLARLDELAHEMAQLKARFRAELPGGRLTVLRARLGQERVCLSLSAVDRAVGMARLKPVVDAPPGLLGLLQIGPRLTPVLCLRRLLGFPPPTYTGASAIVLLSQGTRGLLVDEVEGLFEYDAEGIREADPALPHRKFLWGILTENVLLLNHRALLGESLETGESQTSPRVP